MSMIRINEICIKNYRSFGEAAKIIFPDDNYRKPTAIVGYNNSGKTNLLNSILYGIQEKYISKDTFSLDDFHNRDYNNIPQIYTKITSTLEQKANSKTADLSGHHYLKIKMDGSEIETAGIESYKNYKPNANDYTDNDKKYNAYYASKYYKIFYINFHDIKKEISTKKTSWGNLTSFLAKHIKYIVDSDKDMAKNKDKFKREIRDSTVSILDKSNLRKFVNKIQENYSKNLRDNSCNIEFGLPDYEEIFLDMIFKIGLNGDSKNLVPLDHFGDGYISMFVMAVIQAIAESNIDDKCLFIFEEPESFLHENHQKYFYKAVLCALSEKGHQVIYTTHSAKMIDIFDTQGLIRVEFDDDKKQTVIKYNEAKEDFSSEIAVSEVNGGEVIEKVRDYNNYIKMIEPNLNKIIFSKKVLLVEGANDMMVYSEAIRKKILKLTGNKRFANTYLNFNNISIIPHHGKLTALLVVKLCKHLGLDYYMINDFDFNEDFIDEINFNTEDALKSSDFYNIKLKGIKAYKENGDEICVATKKAMVTSNWKLINEAKDKQIHFNIPRLEEVIGYKMNDKSSIGIWDIIEEMDEFDQKLFPLTLERFLKMDTIQHSLN